MTGAPALADRWQRLLCRLGASAGAADAAFADLSRRYADPARCYHDLGHIAAVLGMIDDLCAPAASAPALELAAWLHDVIYDPRRPDNEARSAEYARALGAALGLPAALTEEAARLILLTRTHEAGDEDEAGRSLLDADLAVLGAAPAEYDRYA